MYTSPHLIRFNERIILLNKEISNKYLLELLEYIRDVNNNKPITFFEIKTALAFYAFYQSKADINILEVGLGGRLDATNVIQKNLISIISTIHKDHKEYLGNNIKNIAYEKSGIIKKNCLVISSKQNFIAKKVIINKTQEKTNKFLIYNQDWKIKNHYLLYKNLKLNLKNLSLLGDHQYMNAACAILACLKSNELHINSNKIEKYLSKIKWQGRLQSLKGNLQRKFMNLNLWIDAAHNVLGFRILVNWILKNNIKNPVFIISLGIRKDYVNILKEIKKVNPINMYLLTEVNFNNQCPYRILKLAKKLNIKATVSENILRTLNKLAASSKEKRATVFIAGSIGLIGEVLVLEKNIFYKF